MLLEGIPQCPRSGGNDDPRQNAPESVVAYPEREPGAQDRAQCGGDSSPRDPTPIDDAMPVETPYGAHVLNQNCDSIRAVGDGGREAEKDENREGEERATRRDDIEYPCGQADRDQDDVASPVCQCVALRRSASPCSGVRWRSR